MKQTKLTKIFPFCYDVKMKEPCNHFATAVGIFKVLVAPFYRRICKYYSYFEDCELK